MVGGRKPKPTVLKKLAGNPGKRPLNPNEAKPRIKKPRCPGHLDEIAKRKFRYLATRLYRIGLVTEIDADSLAQYCEAFSRWVRARQKYGDEMVVNTDKGNPIQNPYVSIANKAFEHMLKLAAEFGMSPSSRTRIHAELPADEPSLADRLFNIIQTAESGEDG